MKKFVSVLIVALMTVMPLSLLTGCASRANQLIIWSQGEYMDEENIFPAFEKWYYEQTNEKVTVVMANPFQSNEAMLSTLEKSGHNSDLICPSDYMVEKMIKKGYVMPLNTEIVDVYTQNLIRPEYVTMTEKFDPEKKYSVPFMYGTLGMLYNLEKTGKKLDSIETLFNAEYKGQKTLKASARDTYIAASIYAQRDELKKVGGDNFENTNSPAYKAAIQGIFDDTSNTLTKKAEAILKAAKADKNILKFDDEEGKYDMIDNKLTAGLYWSCDAGYVMNGFTDDADEYHPGNKNLWFEIPKEGGNIYLDSFVINKDVKNEKAANYFLEFLCTEEAAMLNSEYIGAISPVASAYDALYEKFNAMNFTDEDSIFVGADQAWKDMYMEMMFPSAATISRCGQMRDYGADEDRILLMMADIIHAA